MSDPSSIFGVPTLGSPPGPSLFSVPTLGSPPGPSLFAAPSTLGSNYVRPTPPTLVPLNAYAEKVQIATRWLKSLLDNDVPMVSRDLAGALAAIRAVVGVADAMDETLAFRPQLDSSIVAKCRAFKDKTHALLKSGLDKAGPQMDPRKLIPELDTKVRSAAGELVNLLRDPGHIQDVKVFLEDTSIAASYRYVELWHLETLLSFAVDLLARTDKGDEIDRIAQEIFLQRDQDSSVPAILVKEGKTLWDAFVAATIATTGAVGNLPAPDSLSIALLKCYAAYRLPKAALNQGTARSLEGDVFSMIVDAVKLNDAQKQELRNRVEELKSAQRDVIRAAKAEAETAERLPTHEARIARKTRQRERAEEQCKQKAESVRDFYKDTYGPKNEELFGDFQRGPFMDSFISVLTIIQFYAAFQELNDPDVSTLQKFADITASGLLSLGAVVSTVGRMVPQIDMGIAKLNLAALGKLAESFARPIAAYAGVVAIVTGVAQFLTGLDEHDPEKMVVGGMTAASGIFITLGAVLGGAALTGIGVGIGVLVAGYLAFRALSEALKNDTEKGIDSILEALEKKETWGDKTVIQYLGLEAQLEAVRDGLDGWSCFELLPNPKGSPTRDELRQRMKKLGFDEERANAMIEDPDESPSPWMFPMVP
jgi:hypothetical protein